MSLIIFLIILSALIIVHELGHFLVARFFGIRVDEFGLGFPPRAKSLFVWKGTPFTLNWLPFGGFVKIFGENPSSENSQQKNSELPALGQEEKSQSIPNFSADSFQSKNRAIQAAVLVAGVTGNFLFGWLLISIGFMTGMPAPAGISLPVENPQTVITMVVPGSPADVAGLRSGDTIVSLLRNGEESGTSPEELASFIQSSREPLTFNIDRGGVIDSKTVIPSKTIDKFIESTDPPRIGIAMETIGTVRLSPLSAVWNGLKTTGELTVLTFRSIVSFIIQAFSGSADLSSVTGPVGIVGLVGEAKALGLVNLLTFVALISINLCVINLLPIPALDGGRLLFVIIEAVSRRKVPSTIFNVVNTLGFALLIIMMILVTIQDVRHIFN